MGKRRTLNQVIVSLTHLFHLIGNHLRKVLSNPFIVQLWYLNLVKNKKLLPNPPSEVEEFWSLPY
jgi:hypothetical protein